MVLTISGLLKANKAKKAETLLHKLRKLIELDLAFFNYAPYWKDKSYFIFQGEIELEDQTLNDAYFEIPSRFSRLHDRWNMSVPHYFERDIWTFDGYSEKIYMPGIENVKFEIKGQVMNERVEYDGNIVVNIINNNNSFFRYSG